MSNTSNSGTSGSFEEIPEITIQSIIDEINDQKLNQNKRKDDLDQNPDKKSKKQKVITNFDNLLEPISGAKKSGLSRNSSGYLLIDIKLKKSSKEQIQEILNQMITEIQPIIDLINKEKNINKKKILIQNNKETLRKFTMSEIMKKMGIERSNFNHHKLYYIFYKDTKGYNTNFFNEDLAKLYTNIKKQINKFNLFDKNDVIQFFNNNSKFTIRFIADEMFKGRTKIQDILLNNTENSKKIENQPEIKNQPEISFKKPKIKISEKKIPQPLNITTVKNHNEIENPRAPTSILKPDSKFFICNDPNFYLELSGLVTNLNNQSIGENPEILYKPSNNSDSFNTSKSSQAQTNKTQEFQKEIDNLRNEVEKIKSILESKEKTTFEINKIAAELKKEALKLFN